MITEEPQIKLEDIKFIVKDNKGDDFEISEEKLNLWELHDAMAWNQDEPIRVFIKGKEVINGK